MKFENRSDVDAMPDDPNDILSGGLVPRSADPADRVRRIATQSNIAPDVAEDYLKTTQVESGHNVNVRDSSKGAQGFGQVMPDVRGGTTRTVGGRRYNLRNPDENIEAGLRYFAEGGDDPVARRLYYFGGPRAKQTYERTGRIPNISDGNMTAAQYVKATGAAQSRQDPILSGGLVVKPQQPATQQPDILSGGLVNKDPIAAAEEDVQAKGAAMDRAQTAVLAEARGRGAGMARAQGTVVPMRRRAQQGWGGGGTIGQGLTPTAPVSGMGQPQPNGVGGLRQIDDPETSRIIRAQQQVSAQQTPLEKHLGLEPGAEESKTTALRRTENEAVLERVANEKSAEQQAASQAAWEQANKAEIDNQVAQYRKQIQDSSMTKWLTELQGKGAASLAEFMAGGANTVGAKETANALRIRAVAAAQAAQEESKDRGQASKLAQDILGGFAGSAPELLLMSIGVPPIATFAAGGGLRAKGMGRPVVPAVTEGALQGAAFEIPESSPGVRGTLAHAGKVGAATAGVDLATGKPVSEALKSGAINAGMVAGPGLVAEGTRARPPEVVPPEASIAPVIADARAERVRANLQGAQPTEVPQTAPEGTENAVRLAGAQGRLSILPQPENPIVAGTAQAEPLRIDRSESSSTLNRWQHRDFGLVTESADQSGAGKGKVRVLAEDGTEHIIQRPKGTGAGNQIAVPVRAKPQPIDSRVADEAAQAAENAPFKVIDRRVSQSVTPQTETSLPPNEPASSPQVEPPMAGAAPVTASTPEDVQRGIDLVGQKDWRVKKEVSSTLGTDELPFEIKQDALESLQNFKGKYIANRTDVRWRLRDVPISELTPDARTAAKPGFESDSQELANDIKESGRFQPIVIGPGGIEGSHRIRAAQILNRETIPVYESVAAPSPQSEVGRPESITEDEFYKTHKRGTEGVYEAGQRLDKLPDDTPMYVFHATDKATAGKFAKEGIDTSAKPSNLARERYDRGEYAEFAPGRGLARGVTVAATPDGASGYGRQILAIRIKKGDLKVSPEQSALGVKSPAHALAAEDANIEGRIDPSNITLVGESGRHPESAYKELIKAGKIAPPLGGVEAQTKGEPNARTDISSGEQQPISGTTNESLPVTDSERVPSVVSRSATPETEGRAVREAGPTIEGRAVSELGTDIAPESVRGSKSIPSTAKVETPEPLPDTTSIKHAVVEAERELQGLPQFVKARRSHGESFDQGVAAVRNGDIDPRSLAASIVKEPRPLSTKESMALLYDRMRISNGKELAAAELDAAEKSGNEEKIADAYQKVKQLDAASDANDEAVYRAGSEQGRGLAIRRELINRDYSRAVVTAKLKALNKGRELPPDIQTKVDDLTSRLEQANKRIDDLEKGAGEKQSLAQTDKFVREYKMKLRSQARQRTREVLATERADLKQQFAKLTGSRSVAEFIHSEKGEFDPAKAGEMARVVRDLARNYIEDGVTKAGDIVDSIHAHLKDVSDLSKREVSDLISGYGQIKKTTTDAVEKKLNEVQSILASTSGKADVVEKGIRPLRRGQQRDKPTEDQRRALRELQDAMREQGVKLGEKPYNPETEQATPLDKAKQTTRNRIEQLKSWIASGKKEVQGRQQVIPDSELRQLKAEQAGLEKAAALISDPAADQKAVERRLTELNKSISENQAAIRSGKVKPEVREGARSLWSPEIGAAEKERATLRQIVTDMRADAARKAREAPQPKASFYGATGSWAEYEAEARKTLNVQKASGQRWAGKVRDMQAELTDMQKTGQRAVKPEQKVTPETDEVRVAKRNAKILQSQIDNLGNVIDWRNKNVFQKGLAYTAAGVRAGLLTGTRTIGKIGSALGQSAAQQYMGEVAGEGARKLFPRTAEMAPRHGQRISGESEAEFARGIGRGVKDIPRALMSGETSLTLEAGKRYPQIPTKAGTVLAVPGRVHMAEKNILGSGENARAKVQNRQWAEKQGMDVNDPDVKQWIDDAAAKHAEEIMMLGDNPFSRMVRGGRRMLSKEGQDVSRIFVPVERVPSNYLFGQLIGEYGLGLPRGIARGIASEVRLRRAVAETSTHNMDATIVEAAKELERRNPDLMGKLSPEAADKTMRLLKRGSVGLIYMALGGLSGAGAGKVALGGYYGGAGDKNEVKPGDVKVGPVTIPHWALHSPPNELAQFTSTLKREIQSQVAQNKDQSLGQRVRTGLATGAKGTAQQVPFLNEYVDAVSSLKNGETMSTQMGKWLAARVEPQIMQELAKATDKEETEIARRRPKGFTQAMEMGVPGLRQQVPFNISPVFNNQPSKGSDEMKRLGVNVKGVIIQPDETPDEYEQRRRTVNYNIQQQTDALVSSSAYDKMSEKDKAEAIRKIPEQVADAYRRTQPRKAAKPRQPRTVLAAAP